MEAQKLTRCEHRSANLSPAIGHIAGVMESPQSDSSALLSPSDPLPTPTATGTPDTASSDTRCHFFKIPLELRDDIYDYVAYNEKTLGLHVNMEVVTEPKFHYYDEGLSRTCPQIRQEYTIRLERRIKQLMIDHRAAFERNPVGGEIFYKGLKSHTILIAEREVMKGVWVQVDGASRSVMPFRGILDPGRSLFDTGRDHLGMGCYGSTLTVTLASSAVRGYRRRFGVRNRTCMSLEGHQVPTWDHDTVVRYLSLLEEAAKPTRTNGGFSFGADMQQPIPMCGSAKVLRVSQMGVVGLPGFEDTRGELEGDRRKRGSKR